MDQSNNDNNKVKAKTLTQNNSNYNNNNEAFSRIHDVSTTSTDTNLQSPQSLFSNPTTPSTKPQQQQTDFNETPAVSLQTTGATAAAFNKILKKPKKDNEKLMLLSDDEF
jgi:hypothetical protein